MSIVTMLRRVIKEIFDGEYTTTTPITDDTSYVKFTHSFTVDFELLVNVNRTAQRPRFRKKSDEYMYYSVEWTIRKCSSL